MSKKYPGGIIKGTPVVPTATAASGIWTACQAANYAKQGIWPRSPGAPTIGTATASGLSASITFTAPADTGSAAITTYTATSTPGSITGTSASSPVTVSGLTANTSYTFVVNATNGAGTGPSSAASNSVTATVPGWILTMTGASTNFQTLNFNSGGNIFGSGSTAGSPNTDAFLSQIATDGTVSAKKALSGSDYEAFKNVVVDSSGNIHAFGYNIPTGVGQGQALVMKLNSSYGITWQKKFEYSAYANDEGIASGGIDSSGNVYFSSSYYDGSRLQGMAFQLNSSGTVNWAVRLSSGRDTYPRYSYVDSSGNTYINATDAYNPGVGSYRQVTIKLDGTGAIAWQRTIYRTPANENVNAGEGQSIYADSSGNVYVVGRCQYLSNNGGFVAKYNSSGTLQWNVELGNASIGVSLEGVTADSSGNVYVTGTNVSSNRALIFKFNSSGSLQWQRQLYWSGGAGVSTTGRGINVSGDFVYIGGQIYSSPNGALLAKLKTDGSGTGTVGNWTYDASTFSTSASTLTDATAGFTASTLTSYTTANTSLTLADRTLTDTLVTL